MQPRHVSPLSIRSSCRIVKLLQAWLELPISSWSLQEAGSKSMHQTHLTLQQGQGSACYGSCSCMTQGDLSCSLKTEDDAPVLLTQKHEETRE